MKKGDKIDMGNGFVFHIVGENNNGLSWFGFLAHKPTSLIAIGQTTLTKEFVQQFNKHKNEKR